MRPEESQQAEAEASLKPSALIGNSPTGRSPVSGTSVLLPHLPLSTKEGFGGTEHLNIVIRPGTDAVLIGLGLI